VICESSGVVRVRVLRVQVQVRVRVRVRLVRVRLVRVRVRVRVSCEEGFRVVRVFFRTVEMYVCIGDVQGRAHREADGNHQLPLVGRRPLFGIGENDLDLSDWKFDWFIISRSLIGSVIIINDLSDPHVAVDLQGNRQLVFGKQGKPLLQQSLEVLLRPRQDRFLRFHVAQQVFEVRNAGALAPMLDVFRHLGGGNRHGTRGARPHRRLPRGCFAATTVVVCGGGGGGGGLLFHLPNLEDVKCVVGFRRAAVVVVRRRSLERRRQRRRLRLLLPLTGKGQHSGHTQALDTHVAHVFDDQREALDLTVKERQGRGDVRNAASPLR
jgi:hypothetical protein